MKKFPAVLVFLLVLFSSVFCVRAVQAETISDEILDQAKTQADLFLELKNALGLEWLDEYNAYLQDPVANPTPTWESSVASLINGGYLSASFPADFVITPAGSEVKISRTVSNQTLKDAIKIYIPAAEIVGDTVSLLVQRPAQWVAYEAALNGKVGRDGSGDPDILPGASLDFASGTSINFLSNDGKILGVDSLTYKGEEIEDRFVNVSGDNMTGPLYINGSTVWHAGNDGSGSGLDADLLDGKDSTYFTNAGNLASGIVPVAMLSGTYNIDISGNAATATNANYATSAGNADTVDGRHASDFALSGHTHGQYVQKSGDTMTGNLSFNSPSNVGIVGNPNTWTKIDPNGQRFIVTIPGSLTDGNPNFPVIDLERTDNWQHLWELKASGDMTVRGNPVWHAGNDGSGSGLDADKVDGKHASELDGLIPNGVKQYSSGTYTWTKNPGTRYVFVHVVGGGGTIYSQALGNSYFGSYVVASSGYKSSGAGIGITGDIKIAGNTSTGLSGYPPYGCVKIEYYLLEHYSGGESPRYWYTIESKPVYPGGYAAGWVNVTGVSSVSVRVAGNGAVIVEEYK